MKEIYRKKIDDLNRKIEEVEFRSKIQRGEIKQESQLELEKRFEELRNERAEYRRRTGRVPRHPWWENPKDVRVQGVWRRECLYFPKDNPTKEEQEFYNEVLQNYVNKKIRFPFLLESTKDAFWEWFSDHLSLESDKEYFPEHNHDFDRDFYHDQLEDQDYYYNRRIFGPSGWSQKYLFEEVYKEEEEEYTRRELEKREKNRQQKKKEQKQELADRMRQREFPGSDDILPMLEKIGGTLIKSEEHLPTTSVNDKLSLSRQELD